MYSQKKDPNRCFRRSGVPRFSLEFLMSLIFHHIFIIYINNNIIIMIIYNIDTKFDHPKISKVALILRLPLKTTHLVLILVL